VAGKDLQRVEVVSRAAWRAWLMTHHRQHESIWLVTYKKDKGPHIPWGDIVEEALCFGWVDSLPRKLDERRSMLLVSPRKPGSAWSALNKKRAEAMIAQGQMTKAGQATIDAAKADGTWTKLDAVEALSVPDDLAEAFRRHAGAGNNFDAFPRSARRGILEWIIQAERPETRAKRVEETARLASQNQRANQYVRKS
jgi:uncharacterized protein YdeI (YjbR/CyaY-like superfamily)